MLRYSGVSTREADRDAHVHSAVGRIEDAQPGRVDMSNKFANRNLSIQDLLLVLESEQHSSSLASSRLQQLYLRCAVQDGLDTKNKEEALASVALRYSGTLAPSHRPPPAAQSHQLQALSGLGLAMGAFGKLAVQ